MTPKDTNPTPSVATTSKMPKANLMTPKDTNPTPSLATTSKMPKANLMTPKDTNTTPSLATTSKMPKENHRRLRRSVPYPYIIRPSVKAAGRSTSIIRRSAPIANQYYFRNSAPAAGSTYIIVEKSTGQALTFSRGVLTLTTVPVLSFDPLTSMNLVQTGIFTATRHLHWHCKASEGWLGFRNVVTGGWLGQKEAKDPVLTSDGRFCVKKEKNGDNSYLLTKEFIMVEGAGAVMESVEFKRYARGGRRLVNRKIGALGSNTGDMTWEFVKVNVAPKTN